MKISKWVGIAPFLAAAVFAGPACKKKDDNKSAEKMTTNEKKEAPPPAKPVGLADPSNDPKIVAAAKQVLADCAKTMEEPSGNHKELKKNIRSCDKWGADFRDQKFEKGDATYVNFLDDADVRVRAIGLEGLHSGYGDWKSDKALAGRVVAGLKKEKAPSPIDHQWVQHVSRTPSDAGLDEQIKAIEMDPNTSKDVKVALMAWWPGEAAYQAVKANAASTDPVIINAVVMGYAKHFKEHSDEACAYWADHLETPDEATNALALGRLTGGSLQNETGDSESEDKISGTSDGPSDSNEKRCTADQLGKALALIEKQFAAGKEGDLLPDSLGFLAKDKLSPKPIKDSAIKDLKAMVEKKGYYPGHAALRKLGETGDPAMKKYAQRFAKDPDLKDIVEEINKKK